MCVRTSNWLNLRLRRIWPNDFPCNYTLSIDRHHFMRSWTCEHVIVSDSMNRMIFVYMEFSFHFAVSWTFILNNSIINHIQIFHPIHIRIVQLWTFVKIEIQSQTKQTVWLRMAATFCWIAPLRFFVFFCYFMVFHNTLQHSFNIDRKSYTAAT